MLSQGISRFHKFTFDTENLSAQQTVRRETVKTGFQFFFKLMNKQKTEMGFRHLSYLAKRLSDAIQG